MRRIASLEAGKLLVASPHIKTAEEAFEQSVILLIECDRGGAMGLILNKPFDPLIEQTDIESICGFMATEGLEEQGYDTALFGGPEVLEALNILHENDLGRDLSRIFNTKKIGETDLAYTPFNPDNKIRSDHQLLLQGIVMWDNTALEDETLAGNWYVIDSDPDFIFTTAPEKMWDKSVAQAGIDRNTIRKKPQQIVTPKNRHGKPTSFMN